MLKVGIDFDDVLSPFNKEAIAIKNEKCGTDLCLEDLACWADGARLLGDVYATPEPYLRQSVSDEAKEFIKALSKKSDVFICTAVRPDYATLRVGQIKAAFPGFPEDRIILGAAKEVLSLDVLLDDSSENISRSNARYPVLFRQPWNREVTGVLAVNNYGEFLQVLDQIKLSMVEDRVLPEAPAVIALVGPSGSNKTALAKELERRHGDLFSRPCTYTTNASREGRHNRLVSPEEFAGLSLLEETSYAGHRYGTTKRMIDKAMEGGKFAVMPLDMCGAVAMKRQYPTLIVYCERNPLETVEELLRQFAEESLKDSRPEGSLVREWALRVTSMGAEAKNRSLCDMALCTDDPEDAALRLAGMLGKACPEGTPGSREP